VTDSAEVQRVYDESRGRYGARKIWHQLRRENKNIARCTVERLMKVMGLQGVVRGKQVITTNPDASQPCPDDRVNREFVAQSPNQLCPLIDTAYRLPGNRSAISLTYPHGRAWYMSHLSSMSSLAGSLVGAYQRR
jgi:transposase InsO family protein